MHRNLSLLIVLILTVGFLPLFDRVGWMQDVTIAVVLLSCIRSVSTNRRAAIIAWSLGALPLLSLLLSGVQPEWLDELARLVTLPFFGYTVFVLLRQLMKAREVDAGELFGAASTYLLIGLTWGVVYVVLNSVQPGSFSFPDHDTGTGGSLFYFSFVTLVTLGYGEITPVTEIARSFSVTEAIMGSLFLTILVARLVGLYTATQTQSAKKEPDG